MDHEPLIWTQDQRSALNRKSLFDCNHIPFSLPFQFHLRRPFLPQIDGPSTIASPISIAIRNFVLCIAITPRSDLRLQLAQVHPVRSFDARSNGWVLIASLLLLPSIVNLRLLPHC